jgi:hypothetical protein
VFEILYIGGDGMKKTVFLLTLLFFGVILFSGITFSNSAEIAMQKGNEASVRGDIQTAAKWYCQAGHERFTKAQRNLGF